MSKAKSAAVKLLAMEADFVAAANAAYRQAESSKLSRDANLSQVRFKLLNWKNGHDLGAGNVHIENFQIVHDVDNLGVRRLASRLSVGLYLTAE